MGLFKKESLDLLRSRVDLVEVLSPYVDLKKSGAAHKGLCPFHEERTPSFMIQKGAHHYHCFGCGAHGDAIAFLMSHAHLSFTEAVEQLAERFRVPLEKEQEGQQKGPSRTEIKKCLEATCQFYQFSLLQTEEGKEALDYLAARGIDANFIELFRIGYAPASPISLLRILERQGFSKELMIEAGLVMQSGRDLFHDRVTFPILDSFGSVIGFSARKLREEQTGGKYVNSPETTLFKKSQVLFGLSYSRSRICKERKVVLVEGQIDACRLISSGLTCTVAAQGTAFGIEHVKELTKLEVRSAFLAFDGDKAGQEACEKAGHLLSQEGIEVRVVEMLPGNDPDSWVRKEGIAPFIAALETAVPYLEFLYKKQCQGRDLSSPAQKAELVRTIAQKVQAWGDPVLIHESLRKLSHLAGIPEAVLGTETALGRLPLTGSATAARSLPKASAPLASHGAAIEKDLLRWLLLLPPEEKGLLSLIEENASVELLRDPALKLLFPLLLEQRRHGSIDFLALGSQLEEGAGSYLSDLLSKRIDLPRREEGVRRTLEKLLEREWMGRREAIRARISSGEASEEEALLLAKQFDELRRNPPSLRTPS